MYQRKTLQKCPWVDILQTIIMHLGPLTYTDTEGKSTTFGIVSGPGNNNKTTAIFVRVSNPVILDWIKEGIKSNNE